MPEAYAVAAELTLKSNIPAALREIIDSLEKARRGVVDLQAEFDSLGKAGAGISRMVRSLLKLQDVRFPNGLATGAAALEDKLTGAVGRMDALIERAKALGAEMKGMSGPRVPPGGGGGGRVPGRGGHGGGGGDPLIEGIGGGELLEFYGKNYQDYASVETIYRSMQSDRNLSGNSPAMRKIRDQAAGLLSRYKVLSPLDVARSQAEAYTIAGGNLSEQAGISDMLARVEQSLILRNPNLDRADAQRQAVATLRGLDVSNRFFDPKTGQYNQARADAEVDRVLALTSASNGLATGQNFLSFEKSAKLAGTRLSLEGEAELAHFIDINPSRSGTALNSFENLFGGTASRMKAADKAFWTKQGVFGKDGRVVDSALFYSNPLEWISRHMSGVSLDDINDRTQRQTVGSLIGETRGAQGNINRGAAAIARQNVAGNQDNLLRSPGGALLQFGASLERFRVSLGKFESGPGIKILDGLSTGLDKLTAAMSAHPTAAKDFLELSAGLAALAVVRGAVALSGLGDALGGLGKGIGLFAKSAPAGEALAFLGGAGGLAAIAAGFAAVGAALYGLPAVIKLIEEALGYGDYDKRPYKDRFKPPPSSPPAPSFQPQAVPGDHNLAHRFRPTAYGAGSDTPHAQPISLTVTLDGRTVAQSVSTHLVRMMTPNAMPGTTTWDSRALPTPPGMVTA